MKDKTAKALIMFSALFLILVGVGLYKLFEYQGYSNKKTNKIINYNINDYVYTVPMVFNNYETVYKNINVSKVYLKNLDNKTINDFLKEEDKLIEYITGYYNDLKPINDYDPVNTVTNNIKTQINGTTLSIYYELDFVLDENIFENNIKKYIITKNIDLGTNKELTTDDLLNKYSYTKDYISDKIFTEDVLIQENEMVIDKNTNISLTKMDIERKKDEYKEVIKKNFDNIIKVYIEDKTLVLVYDKKELNDLFFEDEMEVNIKTRYLK